MLIVVHFIFHLLEYFEIIYKYCNLYVWLPRLFVGFRKSFSSRHLDVLHDTTTHPNSVHGQSSGIQKAFVSVSPTKE